MRWPLVILVALAGCRADPVAPAAAPTAPTTTAAAVSAAPATDRWQRKPAPEPEPEARALYRRAATLVQTGRLAEAEPLFAQIQARWPESRFARRLATPGLPPNLLGQAAALAASFGALALYLREGR
ncbi:MAG: hypothetical protein KC583_15975 [Myxococcales bacterium]|nr:hypothetical protein [Myxococcales bacterium]